LTPALANDSFFKVGNYARGNLYRGKKKLHLIGKSVFLTTQQERFSTGGTYPQNGPNIKIVTWSWQNLQNEKQNIQYIIILHQLRSFQTGISQILKRVSGHTSTVVTPV